MNVIYDPETGLHLPSPDQDLPERLKILAALGLGAGLGPGPTGDAGAFATTELTAHFDAFAADLARAADLPYAMVNIVTDRQVFVGLHNPSGGDLPQVGRTMPRDYGYCPDVVDRKLPLVLPDVCAHPRFKGNPVVDKIGIRSYIGAPLIHEPTAIVLGTVCAVGPAARPQSAGRAAWTLITQHRDALMAFLTQHTGQPTN
ncbi:hypothetical protein GCM10010411_74690 [Actinomadura fulvescens]|uniref:GAF domain-containing protein n=1 Tax=Actinomadura fulvescens TaxID=46160 RepID=A0ABN3QIC0_9ACTN